MKKLKTLYKKDPKNLGRVINEVQDNMDWVFNGEGKATRKFDGTSTAIIKGELYKRYDAKIDKKTGKYKRPIPKGAIPCQESDTKSGHHPHWVKCDRSNPGDKYHWEAFDKLDKIVDGTYELCGPKVQKNPENFDSHVLIKHGSEILDVKDLSFDGLKSFLMNENIEGIVFYNDDTNEMCKIRKTDFGIKR